VSLGVKNGDAQHVVIDRESRLAKASARSKLADGDGER
jgi:hypothetical protein